MRAATPRAAPTALLALAVALAVAPARGAEEEAPAGLVHLSVEAEQSVANDRAVAALELTEEDDDPAALAGRVSRRVREALARAEREPGVDVRTGAVQTRPVFHEGELVRWRATQRIVLETARLEALPGLLAELQAHVPLASVAFTVSPEARRAAEEDLIAEALAAFRARAARVAEALGAPGARVHELYVDTGAGRPFPEPRAMAMARASEATAPPLAAGTSEVTVTVRGAVKLERP